MLPALVETAAAGRFGAEHDFTYINGAVKKPARVGRVAESGRQPSAVIATNSNHSCSAD
jgi:hypothetical protein